ncbi:MAG: permease [Fuerstiella sp.]|nr:permease [Fuerstiella sp.]
MLQAVWNIVNELSPWLLLGAVVAGLMHLLIPTGRLKRLLRGRSGLLASVLVGIPLPLCSCSVIPVGIGLRKEGVSSEAAVGFLISTPQTGIDSVLVSGSFLGWPFAIFKVCAALVTGVTGGVLTLATDHHNDTEQATRSPEADPQGTQSLTHRSTNAFLHSVELIRSIWRWLVVGVLVSAMISWLVPHDQLSGITGTTGIAAMLLTLLISLPLYVCATASVPIAAALVNSGLPPGAAMVFLMAGPATNLATLGAVYRTFGTKTTGVYLGTMMGGSIVAGLLFDSVLAVQTVRSSTGHDHSNWFSIVCSIIILVMMTWFAVEDLRRLVRSTPTSGGLTYRITGMNCENCATGLERDIRTLAGVDDVTVRFSSEEARVSGNPEPKDILQVVAKKGFTATEIPQEDEASGKSVTG